MEVGKITLGPAGPPLHKGVFVVLQTVQHFLFSITSTDNDSWIIITPTLAAVIIFNAKQKYIECKKKLQLSSFSFLFFQTQKKQRNKLSSHPIFKNSPFHSDPSCTSEKESSGFWRLQWYKLYNKCEKNPNHFLKKQRETEELIKPKKEAQNPKRNYTQKPDERERERDTK